MINAMPPDKPGITSSAFVVVAIHSLDKLASTQMANPPANNKAIAPNLYIQGALIVFSFY
jgi:hypothetical protein